MPPTLFQGHERSRSELEATQMTRTAYTHFYNIKRMCQPYNCTPYTKRVHRATDSTAVTWCVQEVKSLSQQLESDNNRQVNSGLCARVSNSLHPPAKSGTLAKSSYILRRAKLPDSSRGEHVIREMGNHLSEKPFRPQEFLLNPVPCCQEGRLDEVSYQPQEAELMGGTPALQMEGMGILRELLRVNDWMVKVDLTDAYFTIPIHTDHQPYLRFIVGQKHYQFTCLPFSLSCAPRVFTKEMKPVVIFLRARGGANDSLYRQYSADSRHSSSGGESPESIDFPADRPGVHHQCAKVYHYPNSTDRVPRPEGGLSVPTLKSIWERNSTI